jgi:predicted O-methyltransferase YrrM
MPAIRDKLHALIYYARHLLSAKRKGHGVHSPFAYRLCEEVFYNDDPHYHFPQLEKLRARLSEDHTKVQVEDHGAGSRRMSGRDRTISDIIRNGISGRRQSETLYRLVNFIGAGHTLELGSSVGINALYLALANSKGNVVTIEGSSRLAEIASGLAAEMKANNLSVICAKFDEALPAVLQKLPQLDLLYIDGNHTYEATLRYFNQCLAKKHNLSVFVIDDIYWSREMTRAWREIRENPEVRLTIDTFYRGYVFFTPDPREKMNLKFLV